MPMVFSPFLNGGIYSDYPMPVYPTVCIVYVGDRKFVSLVRRFLDLRGRVLFL